MQVHRGSRASSAFYRQTEALKAIDCRPTTPTIRYATALPPPQRPSHTQHQPRTQRPQRPSQPLPCPLTVPCQSPAARMILARNPASRLATSRTEFPAQHPAERPGRVCRSCGDYGDALRRMATIWGRPATTLPAAECASCAARAARLARAAGRALPPLPPPASSAAALHACDGELCGLSGPV